MGLDTSHDCFHGSYLTFDLFRETLARAAGWPTDGPQPGFEASSGSGIAWSKYVGSQLLGDEFEDSVPDDVLEVLIAHSNAAGVLPVVVLTPLADRLRELLPAVPEATAAYAPAWVDAMPAMVRQFIAGLRRAARTGKEVRFG